MSGSGDPPPCWLIFDHNETTDHTDSDRSDQSEEGLLTIACDLECKDFTFRALDSDDEDQDNDAVYDYQELYDKDDGQPLQFINLPGGQEAIPTLALMAASQYPGSLALLPKALACLVDRMNRIKALIFGIRKEIDGITDYPVLFYLLVDELQDIRWHWSNEYSDVTDTFLYPYRVSLNGVLCGCIRGPKQITRRFVRWIHLRLGIFRSLRVQNIGRKWIHQGFQVYRFTPIPAVTVLRITLCDSKTHQRVLVHVARQP